MSKPYRVYAARPIPQDAEIVDVEGRPHVRLRERGKPVLFKLSKDGKKYLRPSKRWYVDYRDANGAVRRVKGFADFKATEQLGNELQRKADRLKSGITDPAEEHIRRPLADHLRDYGATLESKGGTTEHVQKTLSRISALLNGCGFVYLRDVDAGKTAEWLKRAPPTVFRGIAGGGFFHTVRCRQATWHFRCRGSHRRQTASADRNRQRQGPTLAEGNGSVPGGPHETGNWSGNHQPLRSGRARVLSLVDSARSGLQETRSKLWDTPTPEPTSDAPAGN